MLWLEYFTTFMSEGYILTHQKLLSGRQNPNDRKSGDGQKSRRNPGDYLWNKWTLPSNLRACAELWYAFQPGTCSLRLNSFYGLQISTSATVRTFDRPDFGRPDFRDNSINCSGYDVIWLWHKKSCFTLPGPSCNWWTIAVLCWRRTSLQRHHRRMHWEIQQRCVPLQFLGRKWAFCWRKSEFGTREPTHAL